MSPRPACLPHPYSWSRTEATCNWAAAPSGREVLLPSQQHWWCGERLVIYGHLIPPVPRLQPVYFLPNGSSHRGK